MERHEIAGNNARFVAALERGDAEALAECYAEDGVLMPPDTPALAGRRAIEAFWRAGIDAGLRAVKLETLSLDIVGDVAIESGRAIVHLEPEGGGAIDDVGKYVVIHRRGADGAWRWAVDIYNSDGPADLAGSDAGTAETGGTR